MAEEKNEEKKIIVDDDWKTEAKQEKEKLAEQEKLEHEKQEQDQSKRGPLPQGDFAALISMLVTQAMFAMGALQLEGQQDRQPDLELAKYNIDMLETLEEKTKGNLTDAEQKVLSTTLSQVRMVFVEVSSKVKQ
jgi:hypothetical protein